MTDRAWALTGGFGIDNLRVETRAAREPGPGEALRIEWVSPHRRDLLLVEGVYNPPEPAGGSLLGRRRNGRSGRAGMRAGVRSGDRVVISFFPGWIAGEPDMAKLASALGGPGDGVLRDAATIAESALVPLPPSVSTEAAATLSRAALTAWSAVVEHGAIRPGSVVVTQGTGGFRCSRCNSPSGSARGWWRHLERGQGAKARRARRRRDRQLSPRARLDEAGARARGRPGRPRRRGRRRRHARRVAAPRPPRRNDRADRRALRRQSLGDAAARGDAPGAAAGVTCGPRESLEAMIRAVAANGLDPCVSDRFALRRRAASVPTHGGQRACGQDRDPDRRDRTLQEVATARVFIRGSDVRFDARPIKDDGHFAS